MTELNVGDFNNQSVNDVSYMKGDDDGNTTVFDLVHRGR